MKEILCVVSGRVQGVTYRSFVQKKADALWLFGYVENTTGGTVRVVAQGSEEKLEKFIKYLWKGPFGSHINDVIVTWREPTETFNEFFIKH